MLLRCLLTLHYSPPEVATAINAVANWASTEIPRTKVNEFNGITGRNPSRVSPCQQVAYNELSTPRDFP